MRKKAAGGPKAPPESKKPVQAGKKGKKPRKLTDKQRAWIDFYKQGLSATEAAERAGYRGTPHVLANIGAENLKKLGRHVRDRESVLDSERVADMKEINEFWTAVMRDKNAEMPFRLKASALRARAAGGFTDNVNVNRGVVILAGDDDIPD